MAVLATLIEAIEKKGNYPTDLTETIQIDKNRRSYIITFQKGENVAPVVCKVFGDDLSVVEAVISKSLTPADKKEIKGIKIADVRKTDKESI